MNQVFKTWVVRMCVKLKVPDSQLQRDRDTEVEAETSRDTDTRRDKNTESREVF